MHSVLQPGSVRKRHAPVVVKTGDERRLGRRVVAYGAQIVGVRFALVLATIRSKRALAGQAAAADCSSRCCRCRGASLDEGDLFRQGQTTLAWLTRRAYLVITPSENRSDATYGLV